MDCRSIWKRGISLLLVLLLLLAPVAQVSAEELSGEEGENIVAESEAAEVPEENDSSGETEVPDEPEASHETEAPEETETPNETEPPEETEAPDETESPEETEAPRETELPKETEASNEAEVPGETEIPDETEVPAETDVPAETEPPKKLMRAALWSMPPVMTIAEILGLHANEDILTTEGTVVLAGGTQAVLQDDTGGIRLAFLSAPGIAPGDILQVSGRRTDSGFIVSEFQKNGTGALPAMEAVLSEKCTAIRILVKGATLGRNSLSQNGYTCMLVGGIPQGLAAGDRVDACGVLLDGEFFADTIIAAEDPEPESGFDSQWNFYFGQFHAHTNISDGTGTVEQAFAYARAVENLDFFAVTDHSNSFDNADSGAVDKDGMSVSQEWATGKTAAKEVTDENFVGIFGYEMTWPEDLAIGHINTFGTPGWQTRDQAGMHTLKGYLDALAAVPDSVSQFNHPGLFYGDFRSFADYDPQHDARVHLLEVGGEGSFTAYDAFTTALDAGWHLAPSNNQNNHKGNWGNVSGARTVVLAKELTEESIYDAVRNYRVYATEDPDLKILYHLNDRIMGSIMGETASLTADIQLIDGSGDAVGQVQVVTNGGTVVSSMDITESRGGCSLKVSTGGSYYYLRILRDGEIIAVTAPVWVDKYEDLGIGDLTTNVQKPMQGTSAEVRLTLFNDENIPFQLESVTFAIGTQIIEQLDAPGSVAPLGELTIPLTYTQEVPGRVTIVAAVTGTIGGLPRSYQKTITLHYQAPKAETRSVDQVRSGMLGEVYRVRGYVTAGTANPHNTFPESIYLQDDSGGIEIMDFTAENIQLGTPMEVQGILRSAGGNKVLAMTDYEILKEDYYRHVPRTMTHGVAMDYEAHGGELLQVEGHVVAMTPTADKLGISRFTIRDIVGDLATVMVEEEISSGAYGTNELTTEVKSGRVVRAMGLLHIDEYGKTVIRVRNCDEVAYVPPRLDPSNPKTGDWLHFLSYRK